MPDLAQFQAAFANAIMVDDEPAAPFRPQAFAIYRNTSARGVVEALRASFPTVDALVGADTFTEVALDFRRDTAPAGPVLSEYGADFPGFLARQPWTSELPYLADVAKLDWLWLGSFLAADADSLPTAIGSQARIRLHPATRFAWLATPAFTIWQAHRDPCGFELLEPDWCEEGALFTRPGLQVGAYPIDRACHYLLLLSACSVRIDECVAAVAEAYPQSDVPELVQQCVTAGALIIR